MKDTEGRQPGVGSEMPQKDSLGRGFKTGVLETRNRKRSARIRLLAQHQSGFGEEGLSEMGG